MNENIFAHMEFVYVIAQKAIERYKKVSGDECPGKMDVIAFLETEIDGYREKIRTLEKQKIDNDFSVAEAVQEMADKWATITDCFERIRKAIAEPAQTFTTEQAADGGVMTIDRASIGSVANILLSSGYFVCCHFDDGDTATIEFWRA